MNFALVSFNLLVILSHSLLESVEAQSTEGETSSNVKESLHTLSKAIESLQAKIESQTAILSKLEAKAEMQAISLNNVEALLKQLETNTEIQATKLNKLVAKEECEQPIDQSFTKRTIVALESDDVEVWCVIHGTHQPEIRWTRENGTLASDRMVVENNGKVLLIKNAQLSDEGTYVCVAANGVGNPVSQSVSLEVYGKYLQCHGIIESDKGNLEIEPSSNSCLSVIKLQNTTGFRLQLNHLMTEPILVIPELNPSSSNVHSIRVYGSKNVSYEFEGKSLAIVVPPGNEWRNLNWTGLAPDDSGVLSNTKFVKELEGTLEWESSAGRTDIVFWAFDHEFAGELSWTLNKTVQARDQGNLCENISFSVMQIRPDGNISEIQMTCNGSSEGSLKLETSSQVLVLLQVNSVEAASSKLRVSWTNYDKLLEKNVDGIVAGLDRWLAIVFPFISTDLRSSASTPTPVYGVATDWNSNRIYYLEHKVGIRRFKLGGSESRTLVSDPSSLLFGMAIEPTSGNLYYGNRSSETIIVCNNDAKKCSTIANSSDLSAVFDIAVHRSKGLLFWSISSGKLFRANLDCSNATVIVERNVQGIYVDEHEDRIYWGSADGIKSSDLNGQAIRSFPYVSNHVHDIALDGDNVYYVTLHPHPVRVISKSGRNSGVIGTWKSVVWHIDVFGKQVPHQPSNPCTKSGCAHLCVLVTRWSYRCTCPDTQKLNVDGKTCTV